MAMDDDHEDVETKSLEMKPIISNERSAMMRESPDVVESVRSTFSFIRLRGSQIFVIIKLYMDTYPRTTSLIVACLIGILFFSLLLTFRQPVKRNKLYHDYSKIDMNYNFKASQIDHWCLYGGDDSCNCDDFTEPANRFEKKDWFETHQSNVELLDRKMQYDVVFYGDEVTEGWNGRWLGRSMIPSTYAKQIQQYFNETFTKSGGGNFDGVALGIMGDVVSCYVTTIYIRSIPVIYKTINTLL
jgi:hypothetical protein